MDPAAFWTAIITIGLATRGSVTSWLRSDRHNAAVGGAQGSLHTIGLAVDMIFDEPADALRAAIYFRRAGAHVLDEGNHLHVQALRLDPAPPHVLP